MGVLAGFVVHYLRMTPNPVCNFGLLLVPKLQFGSESKISVHQRSFASIPLHHKRVLTHY